MELSGDVDESQSGRLIIFARVQFAVPPSTQLLLGRHFFGGPQQFASKLLQPF